MISKKKKIVQFGAGNIGRAFIGQVFAREGYEIVFIDVNDSLISELNKKREYRVVVKSNDNPDDTYIVRNVSAIHSREMERIALEISTADLIATSVGKGVLPKIIPTISKGIETRYNENPDKPIDIIIAENIRNGKNYFTDVLAKHLPEDFPIDEYLGLIETSIGKSVPIMKREYVEQDPLWVFSEPYNNLILAKNDLKSKLPDSPNIVLVNNIKAYVDRKLFIHNLGHVSAAYFGYLHNPAIGELSSIMKVNHIVESVRAVMNEAALALIAEYPEDLNKVDLSDHIEDLISRFQNSSLGDTVYRVGRDLSRKLDKTDRLVGAALLCRKHNLPYDNIVEAIVSGLHFKATDTEENMFKSDVDFHEKVKKYGLEYILEKVCHLSINNDFEKSVYHAILTKFNSIKD